MPVDCSRVMTMLTFFSVSSVGVVGWIDSITNSHLH